MVREAILDADGLIRAVASGRQRGADPGLRRLELRYVDLKTGRHLQVTEYDDRQAAVRNVAMTDVADTVEAALAAGFASWHVDTTARTLQARVTKKGRLLVHEAARERPLSAPDRTHDRVKARRLDPADPLFAVLDLTTPRGEVKPSRTAKMRQVEDFLAQLDAVLDDADRLGPVAEGQPDRPLRLVDLGCGNAYLTFAAVRYLTETRGRAVQMVGVDQLAQALAHNTAIAEQVGLAGHVTFVEASIGTVELAAPPDIVLALHACDTATDDALARGVEWGASVLLAAPCCHHDIARQLDRSTGPAEYRPLTRDGILRERFADVLTDALRASLLRLHGYRAEVVEFVDPTHTPRNTLIRAVRTGAPASESVRADYQALVDAWGIEPALQTRLVSAARAGGG
jgi:SAM-dependent methyltransferase